MDDQVELAAQHWDEYTRKYAGKRSGLFWYELPGVLGYVNRRISGRADVDWIQYTVEKYFRTGASSNSFVSLGCGTGHLERELARLQACKVCHAYDISQEAIKMARELASESGYDQIHYEVADVNLLELPSSSYDGAWFYGSLHHISALEHVLDQLQQSLKPGGVLVFNEYVGPARFRFPARQKEVANLCLKLLPRRYRRVLDQTVRLKAEAVAEAETTTALLHEPGSGGPGPRFRRALSRFWKRGAETADPPANRQVPTHHEPTYREEVGFPAIDDVIRDDPSESVRSNEILPIVKERFEIVEETPWGGNIPQFLLSGIAGNFADEDEVAQALLEMIWKIDSTLVQSGEFTSDFAYVAARPRQ